MTFFIDNFLYPYFRSSCLFIKETCDVPISKERTSVFYKNRPTAPLLTPNNQAGYSTLISPQQTPSQKVFNNIMMKQKRNTTLEHQEAGDGNSRRGDSKQGGTTFSNYRRSITSLTGGQRREIRTPNVV